jgi:putative endonuclease
MFSKGTFSPSQQTGLHFEKLALKYLKKHKLKLLHQNYHCRLGEIDLIMQDKDCLVFVEVRYRKSRDFGAGLDTVNASKQRKLILTAQHYLVQMGMYENTATRFDVVSITQPDNKPELSWIKNAFLCEFK